MRRHDNRGQRGETDRERGQARESGKEQVERLKKMLRESSEIKNGK